MKIIPAILGFLLLLWGVGVILTTVGAPGPYGGLRSLSITTLAIPVVGAGLLFVAFYRGRAGARFAKVATVILGALLILPGAYTLAVGASFGIWPLFIPGLLIGACGVAVIVSAFKD